MSQQWFSVIGLSLDLVGVLLVVTEWWRAFGTERRSLTARLFRLTREVVPMEDFDEVKHELAQTHRERSNLAPRARFVIAGIAPIVLGFLGQLIGSWPGGIPALGILASQGGT